MNEVVKMAEGPVTHALVCDRLHNPQAIVEHKCRRSNHSDNGEATKSLRKHQRTQDSWNALR